MRCSVLFFFLVLLFFHLSTSQVLGTNRRTVGNIAYIVTEYQDSWKFYLKTRGRYGYTYLALSRFNTTWEGAYVFMGYVDYTTGAFNYRNITIYRYLGSIKGVLEPNLFQTTPYSVMDQQKDDQNYFPIGRYNNDINMIFNLPKKDFFIDNDTYCHVGFSYGPSPSSPTNFTTSLIHEKTVLQLKNINEVGKQYFSPTARLEILDLHFFILVLFTLFFFFLICFILRCLGKQPLQSRGITPFLACLGHFIHLFSGLTQFIYTLKNFEFNCAIIYFTQQVVILSLLSLSAFHFFRYVMIINLNKEKMSIFKKQENGLSMYFQKENEMTDEEKRIKTEKSQKKFKMIKMLGSTYFQAVVLLLLIMTYTLSYFIGFSADRFRCVKESYWSAVVFVIFGGFIVLCFLGILAYDLFLNMDKFRRCRLLDFWREDVFYYRFEIYFLGFCVALPAYIVTLFMNPDLFYIYSYQRPEVLIVSTFDSIFYWILFFVQCGFVTIITFFKAFTDIGYQKSMQENDIDSILAHPQKKKLFGIFIQSEWAGENLACHDDCERYEKITDPKKAEMTAKYIFELYLNGPGSKLEVNVNKSEIDKVKREIDKENYSPNIFDNIKKCVKTNMIDNLSRFLKTTEFITLSKKNELFGKYERVPQYDKS